MSFGIGNVVYATDFQIVTYVKTDTLADSDLEKFIVVSDSVERYKQIFQQNLTQLFIRYEIPSKRYAELLENPDLAKKSEKQQFAGLHEAVEQIKNELKEKIAQAIQKNFGNTNVKKYHLIRRQLETDELLKARLEKLKVALVRR